METNEEKKQNRRTVLLTVGCAALATAGIVFFILGLLKYNQAGRVREKIIYVTPEFDPTGDEAEENAKVDLVQAQMAFEDKNQIINRINIQRDIEETTYIGENLYAYEYEYVNDYGNQTYAEILWAENDTFVKRFVNGRFVGYTFNVTGEAYNYVKSKQHPLELDAYVLDFESNSGATSFFTTSDESMNEFYAFYTHQEYDPENLKLYHVGIYNVLGYITITPESNDPAKEDFLVIEPKSHGDINDMPYESDFRNDRDRAIPRYDDYARIPESFLIGEGQYAKWYLQPKNGAYCYMNGYNPTINFEDNMWEWTLGYVNTGDCRDDFILNALTSRGYTYDSEAGEYTKVLEQSYRDTLHVEYTHHVKVSYVAAANTPSFEKGLMLIDSSRTWEEIE